LIQRRTLQGLIENLSIACEMTATLRRELARSPKQEAKQAARPMRPSLARP
jgi:hypothetical protein